MTGKRPAAEGVSARAKEIGEPSAESPAACQCRCGATTRSQKDARRCERGHVLTGNTEALKHGVFSKRPETTHPPDLRDAVAAFAAQLESDQAVADGSAHASAVRAGYVRRLVELETLVRLLGQDLATRGVFTARGRTRCTFGNFLSAVSTWDRIASRLGLTRRQREALDIDPISYLERRHAEMDAAGVEAEMGAGAGRNERDAGSETESDE